MPDIHHRFSTSVSTGVLFRGVSTSKGLDAWWTLASRGEAALGTDWDLDFGPEHHWKARVTACEPPHLFELQLVQAQEDWQGTRVRFELEATGARTLLRFAHIGWPEANEHYLASNTCWALYLRLLIKHLEGAPVVPYPDRLDA